jgi:hypothetical protein
MQTKSMRRSLCLARTMLAFMECVSTAGAAGRHAGGYQYAGAAGREPSRVDGANW